MPAPDRRGLTQSGQHTPEPAEFNPSLLQTPPVQPRAPHHRVPSKIKPQNLLRRKSVPRYNIKRTAKSASTLKKGDADAGAVSTEKESAANPDEDSGRETGKDSQNIEHSVQKRPESAENTDFGDKTVDSLEGAKPRLGEPQLEQPIAPPHPEPLHPEPLHPEPLRPEPLRSEPLHSEPHSETPIDADKPRDLSEAPSQQEYFDADFDFENKVEAEPVESFEIVPPVGPQHLEKPSFPAEPVDPRWSFSTQYRSSQILELGQALSAKGAGSGEPSGSQIRRARESIHSMNSVLSDLSTQRKHVHSRTASQVSTQTDPAVPASTSPLSTSSTTPVPPNAPVPPAESRPVSTASSRATRILPLNVNQGSGVLHSADQSSRIEPQHAAVHLASPHRDSEDKYDMPCPPQIPTVLSSSPVKRPVALYPSAGDSSSDVFMSAHELPEDGSVLEEVKTDVKGVSALWSVPSLVDYSSKVPEEGTRAKRHERAPSKNISKLQDLLVQEKDMSFSSVNEQPAATTEPQDQADSEQAGDEPLKEPAVDPPSPSSFSRNPSFSRDALYSRQSFVSTPPHFTTASGIPARKSSKLHNQLSGPAALDSPSSLRQLAIANPSPHEESKKPQEKRHSRRHSRHHSQTEQGHYRRESDPADLSRSRSARTLSSSHRRESRRNFTKKSLQNILAANPTHYDIDDIGLPGPERHLMEKFVDALSKLSIEVQMDESKRAEGRRRLNNALRALEGWI